MLRHMLSSTILASALSLSAAQLSAQTVSKPLVNHDVAAMAQGGLGENTIINAIRAQESSFDISATALLKLKQDGVTAKVLDAMVTAMGNQRTTGSVPQPVTTGINSQRPASATAGLTNSAESTFQAPPEPKAKRSWLKAFAANGAVGRALSSVASNVANGTSQTGSSFKTNFLSSFSNALGNRQSSAYTTGTSNQNTPTSTALAADSPNPGNPYYVSADGNVRPGENSPQGVQGSAQPVVSGTPAPAPGTSTMSATGTQAVIMFTQWRDPREGGFTLNVPQGWQISGGTVRNSAIDPRQVVRATSPDGRIRVFIGDPNLVPREVPNRMTAFARLREGQTTQGAWGGPVLLAQYQTGEQFARSYVSGGLCRQAQIRHSNIVPDATRELNAQAVAYERTVGASAQAWVGEAAFQCGPQTGYVRASTVLAGPANAAQVWLVMELGGFVADPAQASLARYVLDNMVGSVQMDPQWEARQAQATKDVTGAVTRAQQQMAASIAQHAREEAQSNQIDVMSGWEKRNKVMDGIMQRDSNTRLGITTVTDDVQGSHTVSNEYNYYWTRPDGSIAGTITDTPPDYSNGWRMMQKSN
jgi:hypothetical protein